MERLQTRPGGPSMHLAGLLLCVTLAVIATTVGQLRARRVYEVAKPTENIRSSPEGLRLGVLEKGTQIEEISRDGNWVKFEFVGWIWGPSLEGFEEDVPPVQIVAASVGDDDDAPRPASRTRKPRQALGVHLDAIRDLVNDGMGRFYGLSLDTDLSRVTLRFRVADVGEEVLMRRQMRAQTQVDSILAPDVEFARVRIETNRPNGTGAVGQFVAVADTTTIRRLHGGDLDAWLASVQRSDDGGDTWK